MYKKELEVLKNKGRLRNRKIQNNLIDLASNDYLGLAEDKELRKEAFEAAMEFDSHSSKASIVLNGYHEAHRMLEEYLKSLTGYEEALITGSGFLANMALFELGRRGDLFLVDSEYHASGIVGSKLTGATVRFWNHNDLKDLEKKAIDYKRFKRVFVVVEGIYSMQGDAVTKEITSFAQEIGTLIIDEAHSVGTCGKRLLGITDEYSLNPQKTIKMGTLGKALGSYGAYILGSGEIVSFLLNRAKSVIYTTALSPVDTLLGYFALKKIQNNLEEFKQKIEKRKLTFNSDSLIKIIPAKSIEELLKTSQILKQKGVFVGAIRPPTVRQPVFRLILRTNVKMDIISKTIKWISDV